MKTIQIIYHMNGSNLMEFEVEKLVNYSFTLQPQPKLIVGADNTLFLESQNN